MASLKVKASEKSALADLEDVKTERHDWKTPARALAAEQLVERNKLLLQMVKSLAPT